MSASGGCLSRPMRCVASAFGFVLPFTATAAFGVEPSIIGGTDAPPGKWPFQVALLLAGHGNNYRSEWCGGSFVEKFHVVTAAHVVVDFVSQPAGLRVLTGTQSLASGGVRHAIASIQIHPNYNNRRVDYEIAVITLKTPADDILFFATLITQADERTLAKTGTNSYVIGWGSTVSVGV